MKIPPTLVDELAPLIEKHVTQAFNEGYSAGKADSAYPWRHIDSAPTDGMTLLLGVGTSRFLGFWHAGRKAWVQQGTGRAVMPLFWMHIPTILGMEKR